MALESLMKERTCYQFLTIFDVSLFYARSTRKVCNKKKKKIGEKVEKGAR
jgi:hypothetical protein